MDADKKEIDVKGRKVALFEAGSGPPLVYLHGFADIHGVAGDLLPFHQGLAQGRRLIAPAHPACNGSDEFRQGNRIEDFLFHYCEVFDALGLDRFALAGHCAGGWIAAEYAVRHPERVTHLVADRRLRPVRARRAYRRHIHELPGEPGDELREPEAHAVRL